MLGRVGNGGRDVRILICMTHLCPWSMSTAATLQSLDHEVHVFDFEDVPEVGSVSGKVAGVVADFERFRRDQVSAVHLARPPVPGKMRYALYARRFARLARDLRADMVLTLYGGGYTLMAYWSGVRPYCAYVVGSDVLLAGRWVRRINRATLAGASRVFANGGYLAACAREQAPRASVVPLLLGVDTRLFHRAEPRPGPVQIVCTRGFAAVYDNAAILRAVARFPEDAPDFRLVFTSGGELLEEAQGLAAQILRPALREKVAFWGGVPYARLVEALHDSAVYVSTSRSDGTATSLLEALACGLYPVLSDIPQNREWVDPAAGNGRLVPLDDDVALSQALLHAVRTAGEGGRHAAANRAQVEARGDAESNRRVLARMLEEARAEWEARR